VARLRGWLDEGRYALQVSQELEDAARHWRESEDMTDYLAHRGMRGEGVRRLIEQGAIELDADQGSYLRACQEKDQREAQRLAGRVPQGP